MKTIHIYLDDQDYRALEQVAPTVRRQRSRFIRDAIWKAIREHEYERIRLAYLAQPDAEEGDDWSNSGTY